MAALKTNKWYVRYCEEVASGVLELPPYQQQPDGSVQIEYGEAFCRVAECSNARKKYTATNNLVTHLKSHDGVQVPSENKGGRVAQKVIDQAVLWYKGLFVAPGPCPPGPALPSPAVPHPAAGPSPGPSPGPSTQPEPRRATRHSASQDIQPIQLEEDDNIEEASSEEDEDEDEEEDQEDQEDQESEELSDVAETLPPLPLKRDGTVHILDMRKQVVTMGAKVPCGACKVYKNCCKDDEECENFTLFAPR